MLDKKLKEKIIPALMLVFTIIGLMSAIYLTDLYYSTESSDTICDINSTVSCTNLAQSEYSDIGPVPIALLGVVAYLAFLLISSLMLLPNFAKRICSCLTSKNLAKIMLILTSIGMLFTVYLIAVELIIQILCLGCFISWIATGALWILSFIQYHKV
ncbi:hypothetical protein CL619_01820 [archaeon]|nr:hypothetical protein [archaeon]